MSSSEPIRSVGFKQEVQVILIPEKSEIKEAKLDLWWEKHDYSLFQQSAHTEIRLYSSYEKISFREAKRQLYQPSSSDKLYMSAPCSKPSSMSRPLLRPLSRAASEGDAGKVDLSITTDEAEDSLLLCVISNTFAELSQPKCRKPATYDRFTVLIGFLSFTLPLVGYYLLH